MPALPVDTPYHMDRITVREAVEEGRNALSRSATATARLDARLLLGEALGATREWIVAHEDEEMGWTQYAAYRALLERRLGDEPVAYIRGVKEFWSLEIAVDGRVLIPRPDTESLVEACLDARDCIPPGSWIVDVGTGSGAVALALATEMPHVLVLALDRSRDALDVARENVGRHGLEARVLLLASDLLEALRPGGSRIACIAANLPYVRSGDIDDLPAGIREHEPRLALDGGEDGLEIVRRLILQARAVAAPGAILALEVAHDQCDRLAGLLSDDGPWERVRIAEEAGGHRRVVTARRRSSP